MDEEKRKRQIYKSQNLEPRSLLQYKHDKIAMLQGFWVKLELKVTFSKPNAV